jgi:hypothetical protein
VSFWAKLAHLYENNNYFHTNEQAFCHKTNFIQNSQAANGSK